MINKIYLGNFRNFKRKVFEFSPGITVIVGPNASGKTNLLESIFLTASGKSFRAKVEEEMINYEADIARIKARVSSARLEVILTRGEVEVGEDKYEKTPRKRLLLNGVSKRLVDFSGNFKTVLFGPWDLDLVTESPSLRRRFLDTVISQIDREYRRATLSYEKGLRQRNKLLVRIREEGLSRSQLLFWDRLLIKNGDYISQKREEFISYVNSTPSINEQVFEIYYDKSAISDARLDQYAQEEVAAGNTLVGPHRDDFAMSINFEKKVNLKWDKRNLAVYGSRGEQRMGILWLKLAELLFIQKITGERPCLLLDDIFSELDHEHRRIVFKTTRGQQTIITTADRHYLEGFKKVEKINL